MVEAYTRGPGPDRTTIAEIDPGTDTARLRYWDRIRKTDSIVEIPSAAEALIPGTIRKVQTSKTTIIIESPRTLPHDAEVDRETLRRNRDALARDGAELRLPAE